MIVESPARAGYAAGLAVRTACAVHTAVVHVVKAARLFVSGKRAVAQTAHGAAVGKLVVGNISVEIVGRVGDSGARHIEAPKGVSHRIILIHLMLLKKYLMFDVHHYNYMQGDTIRHKINHKIDTVLGICDIYRGINFVENANYIFC